LTESGETIAVVVVTYNSQSLIPDLVASLGPGLRGLAWHLTVADNASADGTLAALREHAPQARVVAMGRNAGYAAGINAAVEAAAPHTAVLVMNHDIRLTEGCVAELVAVLRSERAGTRVGIRAGTRPGIVVPRLALGDGEFSPSLRREPTILRALGDAVIGARRAGRFPRLGEIVTDERRYATETGTDWAEGSVLLVDRACWDACGTWDESFFL
jgi:GT2 family glycosyltransferase